MGVNGPDPAVGTERGGGGHEVGTTRRECFTGDGIASQHWSILASQKHPSHGSGAVVVESFAGDAPHHSTLCLPRGGHL
jgi:hypothetical protein